MPNAWCSASPLLLESPNGLKPEHAALTETIGGRVTPSKRRIPRRRVPLVIGCGPVGWP